PVRQQPGQGTARSGPPHSQPAKYLDVKLLLQRIGRILSMSRYSAPTSSPATTSMNSCCCSSNSRSSSLSEPPRPAAPSGVIAPCPSPAEPLVGLQHHQGFTGDLERTAGQRVTWNARRGGPNGSTFGLGSADRGLRLGLRQARAGSRL